ncbi:hypothetical protein QFC19_001489 [Naganishia cerealis]|uniref:Uncharacterized protein n=1 Tax=Naganishia cerealis TaxID=610337 RepID=A0ACC2WH48_9TREE|nr:hypothetical protein QFC19_001489 [Naganishia cerealis]
MPPKTTANHLGGAAKSKREVISLDDSDEESDEVQAVSKPTTSKPRPSTSAASKRKKLMVSSDDEEDIKPLAKKPNITASKPSASAKKPTVASSAVSKKKPAALRQIIDDEDEGDDDDDEDEYQEEQEEVENVKPKARKPPAPAAKKNAAASGSIAKKSAPVKDDKPKPATSAPKFDFAAAAARRAAGPAAPGSKELPDGAPNCLAGLAIVFTGELQSLSRQEAQDLAKKYGARTPTAPSKVTSYVVLGEGAGPKKLEMIKKIGLKTLDEDGFLALIASRSGQPMDEKAKLKEEKDKEAMRKAALEMEKREKEAESEARRKAKVLGKTGTAVKRYAPTTLKEICGNKGNVEKLSTWLASWPQLYKDGFKKPGKDGLGIYRAILISGPPGIGKTTAAHLVAKLQGYDVIEMNASDTRSKKLIQVGRPLHSDRLEIRASYTSAHRGKNSEKFTIQTPFNIIPEFLGPYAFAKTNRSTLNDRMDLYFQDFSFVPLFMQENYIKQRPARAGKGPGPEVQMETLNLFSKAADSISDGDLLDRLIHGPEQHWALLPAHAAASTIRPAYFVYGTSEANGYSSVSFPQWLGQNSKRMRLARQLGDVQIKMRLKVSGSRDEIRQDYLPLLASKVVLPLTSKKEAAVGAIPNHSRFNDVESSPSIDRLVDEIMPYLDEYYLNKEDWESLVELGIGDMDGDAMLKKIPSQTKSTFTRIYNKIDHPVAFHKADMFSVGKKTTMDKGPLPDIEDVMEDDVDVPDDEPVANDDEANDLKNDKLIKVGGAKKGKGKAAAKPNLATSRAKATSKKAKNSDE